MKNRETSHRVNRILYVILTAFLLILIRLFYLSVLNHETFLKTAHLSQKKRFNIEPSRGLIRDRFGCPLAVNKMHYSVAIYYGEIQNIPRFTAIKNSKGKKVRSYTRRNYVISLSKMLAHHLSMDPESIQDLIYAQASIFPHSMVKIKGGISERTYYTLRALEKDWVGLKTQKETQRFYPQQRVGSDIVGYMGVIHLSQFRLITQEMQTLQTFLKQRADKLPAPLPKGFTQISETQSRLEELKRRVYTSQSHVGRIGIERVFDEDLRGLFGEKQIEIGAKGKQTSPASHQSEPISGKSLSLTISAELQSFAEQLLIKNEKERKENFIHFGKNHHRVASPWIMGGAIVAMIPQTGEVVALASHPRFDPNDFINQNGGRIHQWVETPHHVATIWDGKASWMRESYSPDLDRVYEQEETLSWDHFLSHLLSLNGKVRKAMDKIFSIEKATRLLDLIHTLEEMGETERKDLLLDALYHPLDGHISTRRKVDKEGIERVRDRLGKRVSSSVKEELDTYLGSITYNDDKLLLLDLTRLVLGPFSFSQALLKSVGSDSLTTYRTLCQAYAVVKEELKKQIEAAYDQTIFPIWRKEKFRSYLKEKRKEEKIKRTYQHPYTAHLAQAKIALFNPFWEAHQSDFLETVLFKKVPDDPHLKAVAFHLLQHQNGASKRFLDQLNLLSARFASLPRSEALEYLKSMHNHADLTAPLWGHYPPLSIGSTPSTLQDLASAFYPKNGVGLNKSYAYGSATTLGSLFKPVVGYEALKQEYLKREREGNSIYELNPLTLYDEFNPQVKIKGKGVLGRTLDGRWITRQYKGGRLPKSHTSIGQVDFSSAMQRSSNLYFSVLAGDVISSPSNLYKTTKEFGFGSLTGIDLTGEIPGFVPDDIQDNRTGLYAFAIGQHSLVVTPLQTAIMLSTLSNGGEVLKPQIIKSKSEPSLSHQNSTKSEIRPEVRRSISIPKKVQNKLFDALYKVVWEIQGPAQPYRIQALLKNPELAKEYKSLKDQFIGKTSTAEFAYRPTLEREMSPLICKDIWFGAISFDRKISQNFDSISPEPELVVVVYLRFGDYGKEAAPLAAQIIKKWREIKCKNRK